MRVTTTQIREMKQRGERIPMLTAYDYPTAKLLDEAGIPLILVGDSLGMVVLGFENTLPVTMEMMLHHVGAVVRGAQHALIIADMPFMSYQASQDEAVRNAGRFLQEAGAQAVKLEGGGAVVPLVRRLVETGIPVQGHVGLTPQSVHQLGGYRVQGRGAAEAARLIEEADALADAGVFSIVLETVPAAVARIITQRVPVPTIGIGAGVDCDGQVLVLHDMAGLYPDRKPKHNKAYADVSGVIRGAVEQYATEVREGAFPTDKESFSIPDAELAELERRLTSRL